MSLTMLMMRHHLAQAWLALAMITGGTGATEPATVPPLAPQLTQADAFGGDLVARSQCLTIAMGPAAAAECGDLRLVHELPSVRRFNTVRTPTLIYSSAHAEPMPIVAVNVVLPSGSAGLNRVEAVLRVEGTPRARGVWRGSAWPGTSAARIALAYDADADSTGSYRYVLDVTAHYGADSVRQSMAGRVAVVNRRASPFGAGWWLAGLEQLVINDFGAPIGWVGGDGSYRRLTRVDAATWVAPSVDRPDTLKQDATSGARFVRRVSGGTRVLFDSLGRHVVTRNRLEHETKFSYDGTGRLSRIVLGPLDTIIPPRCEPEWGGFCLPGRIVGGAIYLFGYGRTGGLESISLSVPPELKVDSLRMVAVRASHGRIDAITDPDTTTVTFGYATTSSSRVASRTNRLGAVTVFRYDAAAKLTASRLDLSDSLGQVTDSIVTRLRTVESLGLAAAVDTAVAYTRLDGPRTDVGDTTLFWLDRHGAPRRIRDALGHDTHLARTDATFPALVMELVAANGLVTRATYDTRGNPTTVTVVRPYDDERDAVTTYAWNDTWDEVTQITQPEGEIIRMDYDPVNGNRLWQEDGRGTASRVNFHYYTTGRAAGLLRAIELPGGARDSLAYGAELGNLSLARTARGAETRYEEDAAGRPTVVRQQIDSGNVARWQDDSTMYDLAGRVRRQVSYGPPYNGVDTQRVVVEHVRDAEGADTLVRRQSIPDDARIGVIATHWRYDAAGRPIAEIAPDATPGTLTDNPVDSTWYNPAGLADSIRTRRGHRIRMTYDVLGRLTTRHVPAARYAPRHEGIAAANLVVSESTNPDYPRYPNDASNPDGYTAFADDALFSYDLAGNLQEASNGDARVARRYFPNGALEDETLTLRTLKPMADGTDWTRHVYTTSYGYDRNGRVRELTHPTQLAPVVDGVRREVTRYSYEAFTGAIETITDPLGHAFTYRYTPRGEVGRLQLPRTFAEDYEYEPDGNLRRHLGRSSGSTWRDTRLTYDARGKVLQSANGVNIIDTLVARYSGLGHVISSNLLSKRPSVSGALTILARETFASDALTNLVTKNTLQERWINTTKESSSLRHYTNTYQAATGRVTTVSARDQTDVSTYDAAGNVEFVRGSPRGISGGYEDRASFYGADGLLRAADYRSFPSARAIIGPFRTTFEEFRYDALGRRVLVWSRRYCDNVDEETERGECNQSAIRRTVWDGSRELYEIQMPARDGAPADTVENDTQPVRLALAKDSQGTPTFWDPNPLYGRVAYTYGPAIDQPLSITRMEYADAHFGTDSLVRFRPFTWVPLWNARGQADNWFVAETGTGTFCAMPNRCTLDDFQLAWTVYQPEQRPRHAWAWHGTLLLDKRDHSGTFYRRARQYDARTGRFTQEDPIGLAGGMNLYGFANGDPVNFSDPFGLCPNPLAQGLGSLQCVLQDALAGGKAALSAVGNNVATYLKDHEAELVGVGVALVQTGGGKRPFVRASSAGRMQRQVERGRAPREVDRVDKGNPSDPGDAEPHVHFKDGRAVKQSGEWKHGEGGVTKTIAEWLKGHGWGTP